MVAADAVRRYLYLVKWFEFLNLYTMAREIISLDSAKPKLYVENDNTHFCTAHLMELNYLDVLLNVRIQ